MSGYHLQQLQTSVRIDKLKKKLKKLKKKERKKERKRNQPDK